MSNASLSDTEKRFWGKTKFNPFTECWEWTTSLFRGGYGQFWDGNTNVLAHRWLYRTIVGDIPKNHYVCHACDNPKCVNPRHLFLGTAQDNMDDMVKKGRSRRGEKLHLSKLTEEDVREIRQMSGISQQQIADKYGVCQTTIGRILSRDTWRFA